ncbi:MAG: MFS transporter, partial [Hyphomicrobiaceae bacterium]
AFAGLVGDLLGWRAVFWIIALCGAAAFLNARINLRPAAASAAAVRLDLRSIPAGYLGIFANPRAKFCFAAVFLEGVAVFGLFPFVALLLLAAGEPRAAIAGMVIAGFSIGGVLYSLLVRLLTRRWRPESLMIGGGVVAALAFLLIALDLPCPSSLWHSWCWAWAFIRCTPAFRWRPPSCPRVPAVPPRRCIPRFSSSGTPPAPCSTAWRSRTWVRARPCGSAVC